MIHSLKLWQQIVSNASRAWPFALGALCLSGCAIGYYTHRPTYFQAHEWLPEPSATPATIEKIADYSIESYAGPEVTRKAYLLFLVAWANHHREPTEHILVRKAGAVIAHYDTRLSKVCGAGVGCIPGRIHLLDVGCKNSEKSRDELIAELREKIARQRTFEAQSRCRPLDFAFTSLGLSVAGKPPFDPLELAALKSALGTPTREVTHPFHTYYWDDLGVSLETFDGRVTMRIQIIPTLKFFGERPYCAFSGALLLDGNLVGANTNADSLDRQFDDTSIFAGHTQDHVVDSFFVRRGR